jgi:hypothetical protein
MYETVCAMPLHQFLYLEHYANTLSLLPTHVQSQLQKFSLRPVKTLTWAIEDSDKDIYYQNGRINYLACISLNTDHIQKYSKKKSVDLFTMSSFYEN